MSTTVYTVAEQGFTIDTHSHTLRTLSHRKSNLNYSVYAGRCVYVEKWRKLTVTCNHGITEDSNIDWMFDLDYWFWQETKMLMMDNKQERLKMSMNYSKFHTSKCLYNFNLIIRINMSNLIFNMAWIDLNFKVYNQEDMVLTAQSSLKVLVYYTLRLHSSESHHLLPTWSTLLRYFIKKNLNKKILRIWYFSFILLVMVPT